MKRGMRLAAAAVAAAALGVAGFGGTVATAGGGATVRVGDDFFSPKKLRISSGDKVRFRWVGRRDHNVTKRSGPGRSFASETTDDRGVNFTKRFRRPGKYKLICTVHPDTMRMTVKVR